MVSQSESELAISKLENIASHTSGVPRKSALLHAVSVIRKLTDELKHSRERTDRAEQLLELALDGLYQFNGIEPCRPATVAAQCGDEI